MVNPFDTDNIKLGVPTTLVTGTYSSWKEVFDYDVSNLLYTLRLDFVLVSGGAVNFQINGQYSDDRIWTFELPSSITQPLASGEYRWDLFIVRNSDNEETVIRSGFIRFYLNTDDRRTHAEIMVSKIESILEGRADSDVDSYTIRSRSITKMSATELRSWRDYYRAEVRSTSGSQTGDNRGSHNKLRTRFV